MAGGGIAAEDAAARVVEPHAVLRHLLERHAHAERVEPAARRTPRGAPRAQSPAALVLAERRAKSSSGISGASGSMRCSSGMISSWTKRRICSPSRRSSSGSVKPGNMVMGGDSTTIERRGRCPTLPVAPAMKTARLRGSDLAHPHPTLSPSVREREAPDEHGEEALVAVGADGRLLHRRAGRRRPRGGAAGLHRRVVLRGGRRGRLHAAGRRSALATTACGSASPSPTSTRAGPPRSPPPPPGSRTSRPGRFVLGIGAGSQPIVESWNGGVFSQARHARARDGPVPPRGAGRRARGLQGRDVLRGRLPPDEGARAAGADLHRGARDPACCKVAGEVGDGVILNWNSPEDVPSSVGDRARGRAAGRTRSRGHRGHRAPLRQPRPARPRVGPDRRAAHRRIPERARLPRVPGMARPHRGARPDVGRVGRGRPQGRGGRHPVDRVDGRPDPARHPGRAPGAHPALPRPRHRHGVPLAPDQRARSRSASARSCSTRCAALAPARANPGDVTWPDEVLCRSTAASRPSP